jgi:hypothetical protein
MRDPVVVPCSGWEEKLAIVRAGGLSPTEQEALERHVASCEACARVLHDYLEMDDLLRRCLTADHALEWHKGPLPARSSQRCPPRSPLDRAADPTAWYSIRIAARCWTRYTEMLSNTQQSEEVIVEIFVGQALRGLFEEVTMETVHLHVDSAEPPTKHPLCSIQIAARCHLLLEPRAPKALELAIEDAVSALLQELFGVAIVEEVTIDQHAKQAGEELKEQADPVARMHSMAQSQPS